MNEVIDAVYTHHRAAEAGEIEEITLDDFGVGGNPGREEFGPAREASQSDAARFEHREQPAARGDGGEA